MMKRLLFIALFLGAVVGAAAWALLPRWLPAESAQAAGGGRTMEIAVSKVESINGETTTVSGVVRVEQVNPPELPATEADAGGLFLGRSGDTLTIGGGPIEVTADIKQVNDEAPVETISAQHLGGESTFAVDADTVYYRETTPRPDPSAADVAAGVMFQTRTVEAGSAADLGDNMLIQAWGSVENGILVADIVVYKPVR